MDAPGSSTRDEILSQAASWIGALEAVRAQADAITDLLRRFSHAPLLLSGCGSPYYLSRSAATLLRQYGQRFCLATPASEIVLHPDALLPAGSPALLLIFSRSGETSEAVAAARAVQARGGAVLAVGCDANTTLLRMADLAVEVAAGRERSVVQTRSFAGMLVAAQAIVALAAGEQRGADLLSGLASLPDLAAVAVERARVAVADAQLLHLVRDASIERIFVLGSGTRYGLACEAALKFKEMTLTNAEPLHVLEFRHGPMSLADSRALVIGLLGDAGAQAELAVLQEAHGLGARAVALVERAPAGAQLDALVALDSGLPEAARDVLYLAPLQLMAFERAIARGLDPDSPRHLVPFVRLDLGQAS